MVCFLIPVYRFFPKIMANLSKKEAIQKLGVSWRDEINLPRVIWGGTVR